MSAQIFPGVFAFPEGRNYRQVAARGPIDLEILSRIYPQRTLAVVYNDGQRLFRGTTLPYFYERGLRRMCFLPYRQYCGCGRTVKKTKVHFQHLGHLYGLHGGPVRVVVSGVRGGPWELSLQPREMSVILEYGTKNLPLTTQVLFTRTDVRVHPRVLLPYRPAF